MRKPSGRCVHSIIQVEQLRASVVTCVLLYVLKLSENTYIGHANDAESVLWHVLSGESFALFHCALGTRAFDCVLMAVVDDTVLNSAACVVAKA